MKGRRFSYIFSLAPNLVTFVNVASMETTRVVSYTIILHWRWVFFEPLHGTSAFIDAFKLRTVAGQV